MPAGPAVSSQETAAKNSGDGCSGGIRNGHQGTGVSLDSQAEVPTPSYFQPLWADGKGAQQRRLISEKADGQRAEMGCRRAALWIPWTTPETTQFRANEA